MNQRRLLSIIAAVSIMTAAAHSQSRRTLGPSGQLAILSPLPLEIAQGAPAPIVADRAIAMVLIPEPMPAAPKASTPLKAAPENTGQPSASWFQVAARVNPLAPAATIVPVVLPVVSKPAGAATVQVAASANPLVPQLKTAAISAIAALPAQPVAVDRMSVSAPQIAAAVKPLDQTIAPTFNPVNLSTPKSDAAATLSENSSVKEESAGAPAELSGTPSVISVVPGKTFSIAAPSLGKLPEKTAQEREIERLIALPPPSIPFRNVALSEVLKTLSNYSGMQYFAPTEKEFADKVTFRISGKNPWLLFGVLQKRYNFDMDFSDNIWIFSRINPHEIISRTYRLHNNIPYSIGGGQASTDTSSTSGAGGTPPSSSVGGGGGGRVFKVDYTHMLKDIKDILGQATTGSEATIAADGSVGNFGGLPRPTGKGSSDSESKESASEAKVIFIPDSSELLVYATRQGHQRLEKYLSSIDRPQPLVRIDALLIETQRDPSLFIGLDPSGYARPKIGIKGASQGVGSGSSSTASTAASSEITTPIIDLNRPFAGANALRMPSVVLSASDLSAQLNLLRTDSSSRISEHPNLITRNMSEVSIESVIQEPYAGSTTSQSAAGAGAASTGSTGTQSSQISMLKIGTVINVLPRIIVHRDGSRSVMLDLAMSISGKVGDKNVYGQLVPITSTRKYTYTIEVPDGMTLAIGGLDKTALSGSTNKIPIAGDIPLFGYLFKNKSQTATHSNLIVYITPTIIDRSSSAFSESKYSPLPSPAEYLESSRDQTIRDVEKFDRQVAPKTGQ